MSLIGLELNGTRARAVIGPGEVPPRTLALDGKGSDLPMALSLENRRPEVGRGPGSLVHDHGIPVRGERPRRVFRLHTLRHRRGRQGRDPGGQG